ncbi:MAG: class I SAM-dependent methyltransferase [Acidobacteriota bacterium]
MSSESAETTISLDDEIERKNLEIYTDTEGPAWRSIVYDAVHDGWELINLGGTESIEYVVERAPLGAGSRVLELGCGQGAAARYLAARDRCRVDGIELNEGQVASARRRLDESPAEVAARIRVAVGDAATVPSSLFTPPADAYDAVLAYDLLMLLPNVPQTLSVAFDALRPGGLLAATTLISGPRGDDRIRRFAWEIDGMIDLPPVETYRDRLAAAGFEEIELNDWSERAVTVHGAMDEVLAARRAELETQIGPEGWRGWKEVGDHYMDAFRTGRLGYLMLSARRPA